MKGSARINGGLIILSCCNGLSAPVVHHEDSGVVQYNKAAAVAGVVCAAGGVVLGLYAPHQLNLGCAIPPITSEQPNNTNFSQKCPQSAVKAGVYGLPCCSEVWRGYTKTTVIKATEPDKFFSSFSPENDIVCQRSKPQDANTRMTCVNGCDMYGKIPKGSDIRPIGGSVDYNLHPHGALLCTTDVWETACLLSKLSYRSDLAVKFAELFQQKEMRYIDSEFLRCTVRGQECSFSACSKRVFAWIGIHNVSDQDTQIILRGSSAVDTASEEIVKVFTEVLVSFISPPSKTISYISPDKGAHNCRCEKMIGRPVCKELSDTNR
jgi:hypothetical protein